MKRPRTETAYGKLAGSKLMRQGRLRGSCLTEVKDGRRPGELLVESDSACGACSESASGNHRVQFCKKEMAAEVTRSVLLFGFLFKDILFMYLKGRVREREREIDPPSVVLL